MADPTANAFFPLLRRRAAYSKRRDGKYYRYKHYRAEIVEDCLRRCVYCDCEEREIGGGTNMDLDHFRPKGLKVFVHLTHNPNNLMYSCKCCNALKSNWWPATGTDNTFVGAEGFIEPFEMDRRDFFGVSKDDGAIRAKQHPASYVIGLLALDRPFLRKLREKRMLSIELTGLVAVLKKQAESFLEGHQGADPKEICRLVLEVTTRVERLIN
jgi:5-methylcytosine-specific restriction endonuclease McrA